MSMTPAIILSGHTMALGVVRALGKMKVPIIMVHYDEKDMGHVSKYVKRRVLSPHPENAEEQFIDLLVQNSENFRKGVLFPVSDETVVAVSKNIERLKKHFIVACTDWAVTQIFIEKKYTYAIADANGIPAPRTIIPKSQEELLEYASRVDFPFLVKPSQSHLFYRHFKKKMCPVNNTKELIDIYKQASNAGLEIMLQEIIPGDDEAVVNYNALFIGGEPVAEFTAQHIRNAPPLWGSPRVVLSKDIPEVIEPGRNILRAMNFNGYACTEFKKDARDGIFKLMEVNGRHNLSTLLSVECGINFPWLHYSYMINETIPARDTNINREYKKGIYWIDLPRDIGYSISHYKMERYSLNQYLLPYQKPHVFANLDWKDIRPFLKRISYLFKAGLRRLFA